jgi:hypothetical protein
VVGPFFSGKNHYWGHLGHYLDLLKQFVFSQVDEIERENATVVFFGQDDALSDFSLQVCLALNASFPSQWIARSGLMARPTDPSVSQLDFLMWEYVKRKLC